MNGLRKMQSQKRPVKQIDPKISVLMSQYALLAQHSINFKVLHRYV